MQRWTRLAGDSGAAPARAVREGRLVRDWPTGDGPLLLPYTVLVAIVSVAVASMGPGRISVDGALGLHAAGPAWALCVAVLGMGAGGFVLAASCRHPQ